MVLNYQYSLTKDAQHFHTLPRREGACILQQVEVHQRRETQMKLAAIRTNVELHKACPEVEVVKRLKATFPEFSSDLAKEIPGYAEVDMNQVIVQRAKTWWYTSSQEMIRSFGWHKRKTVLSSSALSLRRGRSSKRPFVWMVGTTGKEWKDRCSSCWTALQVCESDFDLLRVMMGHK